MAQSRRHPAVNSFRKTCRRAVAQKQQYGASAMPLYALETFARGVKLNELRLKGLEPILVLGDDVFRRAGDEVGVAKLRLDLGDFLSHPRDFLVDARSFRREIDQTRERQSDGLAAHQELKRSRRRGRGGVDRADAG